jgi:hypothetical protein
MKKILIIALSITYSLGLFAGNGYVITQKYNDATNKNATVSVTWYVSETKCKLKMDFADDKVKTTSYFIPDLASGKMFTYSDGVVPGASQKRYYTIPVQSVTSNINVSRVSINQTDETKTIAGMTCQKIIIKTNKTTTEMWVTKDFKADFYKYAAFFQNSYELIGLSQESIQGFPLESVTKDNAGTIINSYELVSASSNEFNDADFSVPADYVSAEATGTK